jgi:hypothetical protein
MPSDGKSSPCELKMENSEKLATQGTQYEEKHNTICVRHHYM